MDNFLKHCALAERYGLKAGRRHNSQYSVSAQDFIPQEWQDSLDKNCTFSAQVVSAGLMFVLLSEGFSLKFCIGDGD